MALLKISVVLVIACASAFGEPIFHRGVHNETFYSSNSTSTMQVDGELVSYVTFNVKVKKEVNSRTVAADNSAQIFELVNEHVASMQAMPHTVNAQAPLKSQAYADLHLVRNMTDDMTIVSGSTKPQDKYYINIVSLGYAKN